MIFISTQCMNAVSRVYKPADIHVRTFWEYVNLMFNKVDDDRVRKFGPDRTCAEWVLRNGGKIVWANGSVLGDYNCLPPENVKVPKIMAIDGTNSSISHYGFPHLIGCTMLKRIILHKSNYIEDKAMKALGIYGKNTLNYLQVSNCVGVTDVGLEYLRSLSNLQKLILFNLSSVANLDESKKMLHQHLPNCEIQGGEVIKNDVQ